MDVKIVLKTLIETTGKGYSNTILLKGRKSRNTTQNYGIFRLANHNVELQISGENNRTSFGSFDASVKLLGFEDHVNVTFEIDEGLRFNTTGKVHGLFVVEATCVSPLETWKTQRFLALGEFKSGKSSLMDSLNNLLLDYVTRAYGRAVKREKFFGKREERAKNRLESVLSLLALKKQEFNHSFVEYGNSKRHLKTAAVLFKSIEANVSRRLDWLKKRLNLLCREIEQCPSICQPGVVCRHCEQKIAGKSKHTCLSTCYKTETRRIETNATFVPCKRQQCAKVYVKAGLARDSLHRKLNSLKNDMFSFGRKASDPLQRQRNNDFLTNAKDGLFPGTKREDVCQHAETTNDVDPERVCQADDRNAHWDCSVRTKSCPAAGFRYETILAQYTCEQPCETHVTNETIQKTCCATVPCAFKIENRTCVVQNHFCRKLRMDALEKLFSNGSVEKDLLNHLESARGDLFYWQIRTRTAEIRLNSSSSLLNVTQATVNSLRERYNRAKMSKQNISGILNDKLNLKWIVQQKTKGIRFDSASFEVEIQKGGNFLLPVKFSLEVNGTKQKFNAVINFRSSNASLISIVEDVLDKYGIFAKRNVMKRKKRSVFSRDHNYALSSLQEYHRLCSKFTTYEQALYDMVLSLFHLTKEAKEHVQNTLTPNGTSTLNVGKIFESFKFNLSQAASFGIEMKEEPFLKSLRNDKFFKAANELQKEALKDGIKPLELNSKLLFTNWFLAMENIFDVVLQNCSGFEDCIVFIMDGLSDMNEASGLPGSDEVRAMIGDLRKRLDRLSTATDMNLNDTNEISRDVLNTLQHMREVKLFCARSPNITKMPEPFTDISEGRSLILSCNATGDWLNYNWKFNEEYLPDQTTSSLYIANAMSVHSGNYTCVVSNHVSVETSAPAFVVVHPAPHITIQPAKRLNSIFYTNDSLRCEAESKDKNITYRWYFKAKNLSVFRELTGQRFSYLNFVRLESRHEGWYYCNVSNRYGTSQSLTSYVTVLNSELPVPVASLSFTLSRSRIKKRIFKRSQPNSESVGYEEIKSRLSELLSFVASRNSTGGNSSNSSSGTSNSSMHFYAKVKYLQITECNIVESGRICLWIFQYVGRNLTVDGRGFEEDANRLIGSLRELRDAIGRLIQAVNNDALVFDLGDQRFAVEANSVGVQSVTSACSPGSSLKQNLRCGKI